MTVREWALVGRRSELSAVAAALADPLVAGVVLVGEGGVGKTRLATECLRLGEEAGYATARVMATRSAADIPLGALAPLLPELGGHAVNLLGAARAALAQRAGDAQLLLMVDDAHLLDEASAALLLSIASDRQVFVIVTVRSGETVSDAITSLWKDGHATRLDLGPLPDPNIGELAASIAGRELDAGLIGRLRRLSGGNPLALRELVLGAIEQGQVTDEDTWSMTAALSPRLHDLITSRIGHLEPDELEVLELVALGEPVALDQMAAVASPGIVERLEERGLVAVRDDDGVQQAWLSHPLHGEVVRERMPATRRRRLLRQLVESQSSAPNLRPGDELRVAVWRLELGDTSDQQLLLRAARRAFVAHDLQRTMQLSQAAWTSAPSAAAGHLLGHALCELCRHDEAEAVLAAAEPLAARDDERVLVTMARTENLFRLERYEDAIAANVAAEACVTDPDWRAELIGHRATLVMLHGAPDEALDIVQPMLKSDAARPFIEAAVVAGTAMSSVGRPLDALEVVERAARLHRRTWDRELFQSDPGVHVFSSIIALGDAGRLDDAAALAERAHQAASSQQRGAPLASTTYQRASIALERGRIGTARELARQAVGLYSRHGPVQRRRFPQVTLILACAWTGELDEARAVLGALGVSVVGISKPNELMAEGWLLAMEGHPAKALQLMQDAVVAALAVGALGAACRALHSLTRLGHPELAVDRIDEIAADLQGDFHAARVAHVRAAAGRNAEALTHAAESFAAIGAQLLAAEAFADAAWTFRWRGSPRDATRAIERCRAHAARCEGAATPGLLLGDSPVALTTREREIAVLAARGLATKQIAARLYISPRTVDNHLQRVYDKLGITTRAQLAIALEGT